MNFPTEEDLEISREREWGKQFDTAFKAFLLHVGPSEMNAESAKELVRAASCVADAAAACANERWDKMFSRLRAKQ